jgi:hypothetical protein
MAKKISSATAPLPERDSELLEEIRTIETGAAEEKSVYLDFAKQAYYHFVGDKDKIFGEGTKQSQTLQAKKHYPSITQYANAMIGILTGGRVYPKYISKYSQGQGQSAELDNALFDIYRTLADWDVQMERILLTMLMVGGCAAGAYVDPIRKFPQKIPGIRTFNPYQFHCTRRRRFNEAPERMLSYNLDTMELIAHYPQHAEEIKKLPRSIYDESTKQRSGIPDDVVSGLQYPVVFGQENRLSPNAIKIREFWKLVTTFHRTDEKKDRELAIRETNLLTDAITETLPEVDDYPDVSGWAKNEQFHGGNHLRVHQRAYDDIKGTPWDLGYRESAQRVMGLLQDHIDEHKAKSALLRSDREGYVYDYEAGWRYVVILGDDFIVEDGSSPVLDYGITTCPLYEFNLAEDPLNPRMTPWLVNLLDMGRSINSCFNRMEDLFNTRSDKLLVKQGATSLKNFTNAPDEIIEIAASMDLTGSVMPLKGTEPGPALFQQLNELRSAMEAGAGLYGPMLGKPGSNVRAAKQLEGLQGANAVQTDARLTHIEPQIKKLATDFAMIARKLRPPEEILAPVIDGMMVDVDLDKVFQLQNTPFAIDVIIKPGANKINDEKRNLILSLGPVIMNIITNPALLPGMGELICEAIVKPFGDEFPEIRNLPTKLAKIKEEAMQAAQTEAAAKQAAGEVAAETASPGAIPAQPGTPASTPGTPMKGQG